MTTIAEIVRYHLLEETEWGNRVPLKPAKFYTGKSFTRDYATEVQPKLPYFVEQSDWNNGYRAVFISHFFKAIFTYCEGDLDMTVDDNEWLFEDRLAKAAEFYKDR